MVAGRVGHHTARRLGVRNLEHRVRRAPHLERAEVLQALALEVELGAGRRIEHLAGEHWRALDVRRDALARGLDLGEGEEV